MISATTRPAKLEQVETQVKEYQEFVDLVSRIPSLKSILETYPSQKHTLAFLVQELKDTPQNLKSFKDKIRFEIDSHGENPNAAEVEVSWLILQKKTEVYSLVLFAKIAEAQFNANHKGVQYYTSALSLDKNQNKLNTLIHSQNGRVSFGGVIQDFIPLWA